MNSDVKYLTMNQLINMRTNKTFHPFYTTMYLCNWHKNVTIPNNTDAIALIIIGSIIDAILFGPKLLAIPYCIHKYKEFEKIKCIYLLNAYCVNKHTNVEFPKQFKNVFGNDKNIVYSANDLEINFNKFKRHFESKKQIKCIFSLFKKCVEFVFVQIDLKTNIVLNYDIFMNKVYILYMDKINPYDLKLKNKKIKCGTLLYHTLAE